MRPPTGSHHLHSVCTLRVGQGTGAWVRAHPCTCACKHVLMCVSACVHAHVCDPERGLQGKRQGVCVREIMLELVSRSVCVCMCPCMRAHVCVSMSLGCKARNKVCVHVCLWVCARIPVYLPVRMPMEPLYIHECVHVNRNQKGHPNRKF